ncbi:P-loop NTPase fold protein [Pseudomonas sivasensis]|uniref:P-loop NTPase fold protein n=1 Tax=Pseudomonas sivasensis TaxID=1880678 RepID=A0ABW8DTI3_9PSED
MNNESPPKADSLCSQSHLKGYLEYYKHLTNPEYAVLVTGDWGSGKTHQIKQILNEKEIYYISLFGSQTTEEIYSTVYAKMHPGLSITKKVAKSTDGAGAGPVNVGGLVAGLANAIIRDHVKNDKIIVFDDLERSKIDTNDLLGIFNKYVEHHKCRVIVLAHDKKIAETFKGSKEKVFGQTIVITPQTSQAFDSFAENIKNTATAEIIKKLKQVILDIFNESETHSLRILKHSVEDLSRLLDILTTPYKSNEEALYEFSSLFVALSLEVRAGRLDEDNLKDRSNIIFRYQMAASRDSKTERPVIYDAVERYKSIDLGNRILNDNVLIMLLIKGIYSPSLVHDSLNESLYFTKAADLPAWMVFMKFDELSEPESRDAAEKLISQFEAREITTPGEIFHLFALRFLLSEMTLIPESLKEVEEDCIKYIEDLLEQNKVKPLRANFQVWGEAFSDSFGGFAYWVEESYKPHFSRVTDHFREAESRATIRSYPEFAKTLITLISSDGAKFAEKISLTNSVNNEFANIDIMPSIEPIDFVQEWMGSPAQNWRHIGRGLEQRYASGQLSSYLKSERAWITEVIRLIDRERDKSTQFRKKRLSRVLSSNLRDLARRH